jgi:Flp pilus assembly pilin Flp
MTANKLGCSQKEERHMKKKRQTSRKSGQTMVEYIIIVVIIAIAAIAIFGVFGDTIRQKMSGAVNELGGDSSAASAATDTESADWLRDLDADGAGSP